jgi:Domain of unknown function (DUF5617)
MKMPKVVLYNADGTLMKRKGAVGEKRQLFFPERTKITFAEHSRKGDHIIVFSNDSPASEIIAALRDAGISLRGIQIQGSEIMAAIDGVTPNEKKVNIVNQEMQTLNFNTGVLVDYSLRLKVDPPFIHVLVPTEDPDGKPVSDSYLQAPLLPEIILKEQIKPKVEKIKLTPKENISHDEADGLSNHYHRFTSLYLFKVPASYEKLANSQSTTKNTGYEMGISILSDYCKNQGNCSPILGKLQRFFSGHWNRHHTDVVQELLNKAASSKDTINPVFLLNELKDKLIRAGNPLNPSGSLARRILFLQTKLDINIIDINQLNLQIEQNKIDHRSNQSIV